MSNNATRGYDSMVDAAIDQEYSRRDMQSDRDEMIEDIAEQMLQGGLIKEASIYCAVGIMKYDAEIVLAARTMCDAGVIEVFQDDERVPLIARAKRVISLASDMTRHNAETDILWGDDETYDDENYNLKSEPIFAVRLAASILSYERRNYR